MSAVDESERALLGRQSLKRPLTDDEQALARALETIFAAGEHDFPTVVQRLAERGVKRPSGEGGPWSLDVLMQELVQINTGLDRAYRGGLAE